MANIELPEELTKGYWDTRRGAVPAGSGLESQLKTLQKKHDSIDWKALDDDWARHPASAEALELAWGAVDRRYRTQVLPLKVEALELSAAAQKLGKEKGAGKATLAACREIADAVKTFTRAVDAGLEGLETLYLSARAALKDGGDDDSAEGELLDPLHLMKQLRRCKVDPALRVAFAFVDGDPVHSASLALHHRMVPKMLFARLQQAAGRKMGAFGAGRIDGADLVLRVEKPFAGLVKKVRAPIKASGFKVARIVLEDEQGTVLESDDEESAQGDTAAAVPAAAPVKVGPQVALAQSRLVWEQTRKKVRAELRRLEDVILQICDEEPDLEEIAAGTSNLYGILDVLDERLGDKLDEAYNAEDEARRKALNADARELVRQYVEFVEREPLLQDIDDHNGFIGVAIRSTLTASLTAIGQRLQALS